MQKVNIIAIAIAILCLVLTIISLEQTRTAINNQQQSELKTSERIDTLRTQVDSLEARSAREEQAISMIVGKINLLYSTSKPPKCNDDDKHAIAQSLLRYGRPDRYNLYIAVMATESQMCPSARNKSCVGVFQINKKYHRLSKNDNNNLDDNIRIGCRLLDGLISKHHGDVGRALMRFNGSVAPSNDYAKAVLKIASIIGRDDNERRFS